METQSNGYKLIACPTGFDSKVLQVLQKSTGKVMQFFPDEIEELRQFIDDNFEPPAISPVSLITTPVARVGGGYYENE